MHQSWNESGNHSSATGWLLTLDADELRALLIGLMLDSAEVERLVGKAHAAALPNTEVLSDIEVHTHLESLREAVEEELKPHRRFYDYRQANNYAMEAAPLIDVLVAEAEQATLGLLSTIERALTLVTRTILRSDDSSGMQGDLARQLLEAHALAVNSVPQPLPQREQKRLIKWIVKFRYGGQQDFFDPDIVAYASALGEEAIEQYRTAIEALELAPYNRYPVRRLAVLSREEGPIVAAHGGEPQNEGMARMLVEDLREAGLHEAALKYARAGLQLDDRGWNSDLIDFLVADAIERGDAASALNLRRTRFTDFGTEASFSSLRRTALQLGHWQGEQTRAESLLKERQPVAYAGYLLTDARDDEAWVFAVEHLPIADHTFSVWDELCKTRERTHPAETLPVYRALIGQRLKTADKQNYRDAASLLKRMRATAGRADSAGRADTTGGVRTAEHLGDAEPAFIVEFGRFLAETIERNRRRPRCLEAFARAGLMPKQWSRSTV